MRPPAFLEPDVVLFMHEEAIREHGGRAGLREEALLLSALNRPRDKLAYRPPETLDLYDLAASYAFGLAKNHAFVDGNKRTAWACCVLFLKINGVHLDKPIDQAIARVVGLATSEIGEEEFSLWLRGC